MYSDKMARGFLGAEVTRCATAKKTLSSRTQPLLENSLD